MRSRSIRPAVLAAVAAAVLLFLVVDTPALAAAPQLGGASVQTSKSVKITFTGPVSSSATALSHYAVSPALGLSSATLTDSGYSVLLVTGTQTNGLAYTVTVSGVTGTDGTPLLGSPSTVFIGTALGANTTTSAKDDFNRPFGLIKTDLPIPGPWLSKDISTKNSMGLVGGPTFAGSGALYSHVSDTDPEKDNALVRYATSGKDYYLSAYIYIPSGQKWGSDQEIGLIRMMQSLYTSHARVSAMDQSSSSFYALNVNWKTTGNKYLGPQTVVTGIPFDTWHWIEMHIKDGTSTTKGEVQVWVDGRLSYEQGGIYVYPASMTYAQVGIMHLVTSGPAATTITDEVRFGSAFQLPSQRFDTTAPAVAVTSPTGGSTLGPSVTISASAADDWQVQRVELRVDGTAVSRDDMAPYTYTYNTSGLSSGTHTISAYAYDTSGNRSALSSVTVTKP